MHLSPCLRLCYHKTGLSLRCIVRSSSMSVKISKVLLLDNVDPAAKEILESNSIQAHLCKEKFSTPDLISKLQNYDAVVVRSATKVTSEVIESCPNLRIIGRAGTGVDNIDVKAATKHGVAVMNTPGGNTLSAAEHTCTLICCLARNVPAADAHVKAGKWDRKAFMGHEIFGKVLAIIGLGRIGLEVAQRMQSFGMRTIGYDPIVSADVAKKYNIEWLELDQIWPQCDYITVHTPLIPQTRGLVNAKVFAICKPGVRVINCARGGIIDEDCLLKALESGACGGAGLDVFVDEPTQNTALVNHPKVVACPHLGASTKEGQARCGREIAQQFVDVNNASSYFGIINAPALTSNNSPKASLWNMVGNNLALIVKAYMTSNSYKLVVSVNGTGLDGMGRALQAAVCSGLVESKKANLINSVTLAQESGIEVSTQHNHGEEDFLALNVTNECHSLELQGGVRNGKPTLLGICRMKLSSPLQLAGSILIFKADHNPKKLSEVITALAANGIMPGVISVASPSNGSMWTAVTLLDAVPDVAVVKPIVDKVIIVRF